MTSDTKSTGYVIWSYFRGQVMPGAFVVQSYAFFVMQTYLTNVWGLSFTHAAGILNIWQGTRMILPILLHPVNEYLGDFWMRVLYGILNTLGMILLSISTPPVLGNLRGTCRHNKPECIGHAHKVLFYTGLAVVALALAGYSVSLYDSNQEKRKKRKPNQKFSQFLILAIKALAVMLLPRMLAVGLPEGNLWWLRFGLPAMLIFVAVCIFLSGWRDNDETDRQKSTVTTMIRVFKARASNHFQQSPKHASFIEMACSAEEVKETKIVVRMVPMWLAFVMCGVVSSIGNTYFVEQLNHLSRKVGTWNVPLPFFLLLTDLSKFFSTTLAKWLYFVTSKRKEDKKYRGRPIVVIAVAMVFLVLCCIAAAYFERQRLDVVRSHHLLDKPDDYIPMGAYRLFFQFLLLGIADIDIINHAAVTYYDCLEDVPETMVNCLEDFTQGGLGLGYIVGVFSVFIVGRISGWGERSSWFQFTLNQSRLDNYYWVLAALSSVNLVIFVGMASVYWPRAVDKDEEGASIDK